MYNYKIDLSTYYPSNDNKFNIYLDSLENKIASDVSLPYVIQISTWKASYTLYLENLSEGCGEINEYIIDGYSTTTTTMNFILTTQPYFAPTTLFTTTTTSTTTSTTITTLTTQYVPPTTLLTTTRPPSTPPPTEPPSTPPPIGYTAWYNNPYHKKATKNNCPDGCTGNDYTYSVPYGRYSVSKPNGENGQAEVDAMAYQDAEDNAQNAANTYGTCSNCPAPQYWNTEQTITKTKNDCGDCEGTSVNYVVAANSYWSYTSVEDANGIAISVNQENAQTNANLNGSCINCPPPPTNPPETTNIPETTQAPPASLYISVASSCIFNSGFISVGAYNGVPYENGNYEFNLDGGAWEFAAGQYGYNGVSDGLHTVNIRDAQGTTRSQQVNISCYVAPPETTQAPPPPCECHSGRVTNMGVYYFTNCSGQYESGEITNRDDINFQVCIDISQGYTNVEIGVLNGAGCNCS